jgi:hypothetical protein
MLPRNLELLRQGEEALREETLRRTSEWPEIKQHLYMMERAMDLIHNLISSGDSEDRDLMCLRMLGARTFNSLAVTIKLSLGGYYQASALQLRDVLETIFLLDYFSMDRSLVTEWRTAPDKQRRKKFGPAVVRKALDYRDALTTSKRTETYDMFCRLAAHPTPDSATMLMPVQGSKTIHVGPFLEPEGLKALLSEATVCAVQVGMVFRRLIGAKTIEQLESGVAFSEAQSEWFSEFFGVEPDEANLEALRSLLNTARQEDDSHGG